MGIKTNNMRLNHKKVVRKKQNSGRCYNYQEGIGWNHYTKGFRKHSLNQKQLSDGYTFLYSFLSLANIQVENKETEQSTEE